MPDDPTITDLNESEQQFVSEHRALLVELLESAGMPEAADAGPLWAGQRLIAWWKSLRRSKQPDPHPMLFSVGIALGDELIQRLDGVLPLRWCIVDYPDGSRELSVACEDPMIILTPPHTVTKLIEPRNDNTVPGMADFLESRLREHVRKLAE